MKIVMGTEYIKPETRISLASNLIEAGYAIIDSGANRELTIQGCSQGIGSCDSMIRALHIVKRYELLENN